ncbi:MAG TPA: MFS transporter [Steroidobacteraceae bacterium]|jgi:DHA1 family tetracycline resistance protein-like MFS transporter
MLPLFVVVVIDLLGFGILIPLLPYMAERFGTSPALITPIFGVYSLCQLVAAPFWGRLSDRHGRRPILMTSLAGAFVSYVMLGLAQNLGWLIAARMLAGFMAGNIAAAFAYASDISTPESRAKALGMVGAAIGIGFMVGPFIGGVLAGPDERTANFALPAAVSALMTLIAIAVVYFRLPESHAAEHRTEQHEPRRRPIELLRERPALRLIVVGAFLVICAQSTLESIFAIWALHTFGFGPFTVGVLLFCLALIPVTMQAGLVRVLAPRFGEVRLAVTAVASYVTGLLVVAYSSHLPLALIGLAFCGVGSGLFSPSASALASKQATPKDRGAVMGTYQSGLSLARAFVPFASGALYAGLGSSAPFVAGACVSLPAAWFIWHSQRAARTMAP